MMKNKQFLSLAPAPVQEKKGNDGFLIWWMVILILAKLWLVEAQDFLATYTPHDDYLFIKLAKHILSGAWLGPYDQVTLVKGPVYPLFIALGNLLGIPLLLFQHLLYSGICVVAVMAFRPLLGKQWLFLFLFFFLLFNPFTYVYPATGRAFRFGLSVPLVLAFFSCMGAMLLRVQSSLASQLRWSIATAAVFALLWYTREEGIWLLPSLGLFLLYFLFTPSPFRSKKIIKKVALLLPVPILFLGLTVILSLLNQKYYGAGCIIELKSPEFQSALGNLMNINEVENNRFVVVSRKNQEAAFAVSPTFRKLKPYFEEAQKGPHLPQSFYIWVLRDMVDKSGNCDTLPEALEFYRKIGEEIHDACESGKISCLDRKPTIKPRWKAKYVQLIPETFWDIFATGISFRHFRTTHGDFLRTTTAPAKMIQDYRFVTREKIAPGHRHKIKEYPEYVKRLMEEKFRLLVDIGNSYKKIIPFLFSIALLIHFIIIGRAIKRREVDFASAYGSIILVGMLSLTSVLTYVKITLWGVTRPLMSIYPLVLLYISMMFIFSCTFIKKHTPDAHRRGTRC
ncbi:MAG: hypothetical protein D3908_00265 [Candidatus Electrothrix sp. AUS4]|nr:hypothetical protein [Candidatus Electrothrix sp. AUS4]